VAPRASPPARPPLRYVGEGAARELASHGPSSLDTRYSDTRRRRQWAGGRASRKKYKMPSRQKPDGTVAGSSESLASRFYQLSAGGAGSGRGHGTTSSRCAPSGRPNGRSCRQRCGGKEEGEGPVKQDQPLANERRSQAILDFLSATDVGKLFPAEKAARNEVPKWSAGSGKRRGGRGVGAGEELPLFLQTPSFMASADEE